MLYVFFFFCVSLVSSKKCCSFSYLLKFELSFIQFFISFSYPFHGGNLRQDKFQQHKIWHVLRLISVVSACETSDLHHWQTLSQKIIWNKNKSILYRVNVSFSQRLIFWGSEWFLFQHSEQYFSYIMARTSCISMRRCPFFNHLALSVPDEGYSRNTSFTWYLCFYSTRPTLSVGRHVALLRLFWFWDNQRSNKYQFYKIPLKYDIWFIGWFFKTFCGECIYQNDKKKTFLLSLVSLDLTDLQKKK